MIFMAEMEKKSMKGLESCLILKQKLGKKIPGQHLQICCNTFFDNILNVFEDGIMLYIKWGIFGRENKWFVPFSEDEEKDKESLDKMKKYIEQRYRDQHERLYKRI